MLLLGNAMMRCLVRLGVLSFRVDEAQGGCRSKYLYPARCIPESSRYCLLIMIGSSSALFMFPDDCSSKVVATS